MRAELTAEIKDIARRHLAEEGSAALSLRAVARELGMVSSAVYRYFPSRDDLLTALIVDAYDAVGLAAEEADARCEPGDVLRRWLAICARAARMGHGPTRTSTRSSTAAPYPATPHPPTPSTRGGSASCCCA